MWWWWARERGGAPGRACASMRPPPSSDEFADLRSALSGDAALVVRPPASAAADQQAEAYERALWGAKWDVAQLKRRSSGWSREANGTNTWNVDGLEERMPAAIASPASARDVAECVLYAAARRSEGQRLCVAGGRFSQLSLAEGALCIDLSRMRSARCDATAATVVAQGGCLVGDVMSACQPHALAVPLGAHPGTGIGGMVLQGGHGWLERSAGLAVDALLSAQVVLASGDIMRASADENADLFWAIRGGGGGFGVVTEFVFRAAPVGEAGQVQRITKVYVPLKAFSALRFQPSRLECLRNFRDACIAVDGVDELAMEAVVLVGGPTIASMVSFSSSLARGEAALKEHGRAFQKLRAVANALKPCSYHDGLMYDVFSPSMEANLQSRYYRTGSLHEDLPDAALKAISDATSGKQPCSKGTQVLITLLGGKAKRCVVGTRAPWHRPSLESQWRGRRSSR